MFFWVFCLPSCPLIYWEHILTKDNHDFMKESTLTDIPFLNYYMILFQKVESFHCQFTSADYETCDFLPFCLPFDNHLVASVRILQIQKKNYFWKKSFLLNILDKNTGERAFILDIYHFLFNNIHCHKSENLT